MAMKEGNYERWRTENEGPSSGPGARDDFSDHGRSSEYGANFRDASQYGTDRQRFGGNDRRPSNFNERYQGNDAGVPYRQNRYGQEQQGRERYGQEDGGWYGSGNEQRYGRDREARDNNFGFAEGGYRGENRYGSGNLYGANRHGGEQYGGENRYGSYGRYGTSRGSLPDYDSSLYGAGSGSVRSDWHDYNRDSGHTDETVMQKVGRFFGIGPKGYKRSDARIQEDVNDALMDDHYVDATHIEVVMKDGEITLEGYVEDRETKRRAEDVVCAVRGVKDCHNHLRIRPLSQATIGAAAGETTTNSPADRKDRNRHNTVS